MPVYGKTAAKAIAVMSYLASNPGKRCGAAEIAKGRDISKVFTAKLLTKLAAADLIIGQPGPGGGYWLAREAREITLREIVSLFEQPRSRSLCPFGPNWCGTGAKCPLHDALMGFNDSYLKFMENTSLAAFGLDPVPAAT